MADLIELTTTGAAAVRTAFANQIEYCLKNGAPLTARVVAALASALDHAEGSAFLQRIAGWTGAPLGDALALRAAGGVHAMHLAGKSGEIAALFRDATMQDEDGARMGRFVREHEAELLPWLDGPPQTNEAGRSSSFIAAMLWLAARGLPARFECFEIGSSAGINLMIDRYRYDLAGVTVGPEGAAMAFRPEWRGSPPSAGPLTFSSLKGCDVAPVDLTDPVQALRLKAYIWPDHIERFARMEAAIAAAQEQRPSIARMDAAEFVETELGRPQQGGTTRVLMHSIVWQYVPADQQARVTAAMEAAGRLATAERPLAWIALEANRTLHHHELVVRHWPGDGAPVMLGRAHAHGAWVELFEAPR